MVKADTSDWVFRFFFRIDLNAIEDRDSIIQLEKAAEIIEADKCEWKKRIPKTDVKHHSMNANKKWSTELIYLLAYIRIYVKIPMDFEMELFFFFSP